MKNSFENLIEKFGVPKIIIPNTPRILAQIGNCLTVGQDTEISLDKSDKIHHRRFQYGDAEFLAVKSFIETDMNNETALLEHLRNQNYKPIEFVYNYKKYTRATVSVATNADVAPVNRVELLEAVQQQRLLWVYDWSSMGDAYLHFCHCSAERLPDVKNVGGIHFLFEAPHRIPPAMLVGIGEDFDRGDNIWDYCARELFYRSFL